MKITLLLLIGILFSCQTVCAFDHTHALWDALLKEHVSWNAAGTASRVDYAALQQQQILNSYLRQLTAVEAAEYQSWGKAEQLAFLINAYNAFTFNLILSKYPDVESIKDLGSLFSSPWKKQFFRLLGEQRSLDQLEHELIRQPGVFADPRIHAAVVCASIGCPGIRNEAFVAARLDVQLEDSLRRFLADRSRNRYNPEIDQLEISKIFDWYGDDFIGFRGASSVSGFLGGYAELLTDSTSEQLRVRAGDTPIRYLDYDWRLNDYRGAF